MSCISVAMRCTLQTVSFINLLYGVLLLGNAWFLSDISPRFLMNYLFFYGGIIFLTGCVGYVSVDRKNVCLSVSYAYIVLCLLILQIGSKFFSIDITAIEKIAADDVEEIWLKEIEHPGIMNVTQETYRCCGKNHPDDYFTINRTTYPESCYPEYIVNVTALYKTGCIPVAKARYVQFFNYSASGTWFTLAWTALMLVLAIYVAKLYRRRDQRFNYKPAI